MSVDVREGLEPLIGQWRTYAVEHAAGDGAGLEETERQIRDDSAELLAAGLSADEAFLIALKRAAEADAVSGEFASAYAEALLKPSGVPTREHAPDRETATQIWVMLGFAVAAAVAVKVPVLFGYEFSADPSFYARNLSLFVLPFMAAYLGWTRKLAPGPSLVLAGVFVLGAVFANVYAFTPGGSTEALTAIHLPVVLWLAVGVAYVGGEWRSDARRMQYARFTGEWLVTYALIALGGGVLIAISVGIFEAIGLNAGPFMQEWVLPCGAMGAVIVAAWLVDGRRNLVGGMAPMLARVFTPLFALMLVALLVGVVWTGGFLDVEREVLILFDLLLVVVLALLLYAISARDAHAEPDLFDRIQLVLVASALIADVFALASISGRLSAYGFSANKTAALGLNIILLVNLAWSAALQVGFLRSRRGFADVERWQMRYLPVYALWAAIVVIAFPPLFGFS